MSINRVNITGNLTRDPELRATAVGTQVLSFGIAVNDRRKNPQTGEWEDYPNYIDCTMFGTRAEAVGRYISKGSKVAIEFMNSRPAASPAAAVDGGQQYAVPEAPAVEVADEDIPF